LGLGVAALAVTLFVMHRRANHDKFSATWNVEPVEQDAQVDAATMPSSESDPHSVEDRWLQYNLSASDVHRYATGVLLPATIAEIVKSVDSFTITAADNDTWNIVQIQKTQTRYLPGTEEERLGETAQSSTCSVRYKEIPWKNSYVASTYIGTDTFQHSDDLVGVRDELVILADPSLLNCTGHVNSGNGDEVTTSSGDLSLAFASFDDAKQARNAIILHVKAQLPR